MNCKYCHQELSIYNETDKVLTVICNPCQAAFYYYKLSKDKICLDKICLQTYINDKLYKIFMHNNRTNIFHYIEPEISNFAHLVLQFNFNLKLLPININQKLKTILIFS
jgi:hypothetical protein